MKHLGLPQRPSPRGAALRGVLLVLLFLPLLLLPATPAWTQSAPERRVALVIGVGAYQNAPTLGNPVRDARAVGDALRKLNFEVEVVADPDLRALTRALREFGVRAQRADAAVLYYAGHGVQVGRENYLLPVDTRVERERDLLYEAVPLELALGEASQAKKLSIVLLDACRDNPFLERISRAMTAASRAAVSQGLARVDNVPRNTVVAMATKADQVAEDGAGGGHSPFAEALLKQLATPGVELSLFFRGVRDAVLRATDGRQEPYVFSSLGADPFYLNPRPPNRPPVLGDMPALEVRDNAGASPLRIGAPTDPDGDPLTARVVGLPRYGEVRVDGRPIRPGAAFAADRLATATYQPEAGRTGAVGGFDIVVEDGQGGEVRGSVAISVIPSNRPPVVEGPRRLRLYTGPLNIAKPEDPDGDPVVVTVRAVPRGQVRSGVSVLRVGDRLRPEDLAALVFVPEAGFVGYAGALRYVADDGRGGTAEGSLDIDVMDVVEGAAHLAETAFWEQVRTRGQPGDFDAFLRLYPNSQYSETAQRMRNELLARGAPSPSASPPAASPPAAAPPAQTAAQGRRPAVVPPSPGPAVTASAPVPAAPPLPAVKAERPPSPPPAPAPERLAMAQPPVPPSASAQDAGRGMAPKPAAPDTGPGGTFQDCPTCPVMARVPAGGFMMGQGAKDPAALPAHHVTLRAFALGQSPVTVAEWRLCAAEGGCAPPPRMAVTEDSTPLHNVSWDDAQTYLTWLSRKAGQTYRLPSEAEWEYAARAGTTTRYWWSDQIGIGLANCGDCGGPQEARAPMPATAFQPNAFNLHGMGGGVAQWTADCWFPNYAGAPADGSARDGKACTKRVLRGGSFKSARDDITPVARNFYDAPVRYFTNGFRVARDLN